MMFSQNLPILAERESAKKAERFFDKVVPGEMIFPWVHGHECELQQAELMRKHTDHVRKDNELRKTNERIGTFTDFRSPTQRKDSLIQQMTIQPQLDRMETLSPTRVNLKKTRSSFSDSQ